VHVLEGGAGSSHSILFSPAREKATVAARTEKATSLHGLMPHHIASDISEYDSWNSKEKQVSAGSKAARGNGRERPAKSGPLLTTADILSLNKAAKVAAMASLKSTPRSVSRTRSATTAAQASGQVRGRSKSIGSSGQREREKARGAAGPPSSGSGKGKENAGGQGNRAFWPQRMGEIEEDAEMTGGSVVGSQFQLQIPLIPRRPSMDSLMKVSGCMYIYSRIDAVMRWCSFVSNRSVSANSAP
jgi:hypothetical protein